MWYFRKVLSFQHVTECSVCAGLNIFEDFGKCRSLFWLNNQNPCGGRLLDRGSWKKEKAGMRNFLLKPGIYYDGWYWQSCLYEKDIFSIFIVSSMIGLWVSGCWMYRKMNDANATDAVSGQFHLSCLAEGHFAERLLISAVAPNSISSCILPIFRFRLKLSSCQ